MGGTKTFSKATMGTHIHNAIIVTGIEDKLKPIYEGVKILIQQHLPEDFSLLSPIIKGHVNSYASFSLMPSGHSYDPSSEEIRLRGKIIDLLEGSDADFVAVDFGLDLERYPEITSAPVDYLHKRFES